MRTAPNPYAPPSCLNEPSFEAPAEIGGDPLDLNATWHLVRPTRILVQVMASATLAAAFIGWQYFGRAAAPDALPVAVGVAFLLCLLVNANRRFRKELHKKFGSWRYDLEEDRVVRRCDDLPTFEMLRADVDSVTETRKGLAVCPTKGEGLLILRSVRGYEQYREALTAWAAPRPAPRKLARVGLLIQYLIPIVWLVSSWVAVFATDTWLVRAGAGGLIAYPAWVFQGMRRTRMVSEKNKRRTGGVAVAFALFGIVRIWMSF